MYVLFMDFRVCENRCNNIERTNANETKPVWIMQPENRRKRDRSTRSCFSRGLSKQGHIFFAAFPFFA